LTTQNTAPIAGAVPADSGVSGSPGALLAAAVQQRLARALEPAAGLASAA